MAVRPQEGQLRSEARGPGHESATGSHLGDQRSTGGVVGGAVDWAIGSMSTSITSAASVLRDSSNACRQSPIQPQGVSCHETVTPAVRSWGTQDVIVMSRRVTLHRGQCGREQSVRSLQIKSSAQPRSRNDVVQGKTQSAASRQQTRTKTKSWLDTSFGR